MLLKSLKGNKVNQNKQGLHYYFSFGEPISIEYQQLS